MVRNNIVYEKDPDVTDVFHYVDIMIPDPWRKTASPHFRMKTINIDVWEIESND